MSKTLKIEGNYFIVYDSVSGTEEIRTPRGGVTFKVLPTGGASNYEFYRNVPKKAGAFDSYLLGDNNSPYSFSDILDDRTGSAFTSESALNSYLSNRTGFFFDGITRDFLLEVAKGNVPGHSLVHKFGRNTSISSTLVPVSTAGVYQTPTSAVALEFLSSSASDALNSTGMHEITVVGIDASWNLQTVTTSAHATDGTTAVAITGSWFRVFRAYVSKSGSYATASTASHVGVITIRVAGAGATWATIPLEGSFGLGQTTIGAYTVPAGHTAFILSAEYSSNISGTKTADFFFFQRDNANDVTGSTYDGSLRIQEVQIGTQGAFQQTHFSAEGYSEYTDIGFLAKATASTDASVAFELLIVDNDYI